jgi:hypothetical protein
VIEFFPVDELRPLVGSATFDADLAAAAREVATGVVLATCDLSEVPAIPPVGMVAVCKKIAARVYANPTDLRAETTSGYAATFAASSLDDDDRTVLARVSSQLRTAIRARSVTLDY